MNIKDLVFKYKNFVFIGEAGSGKSELAVNIAIHISKQNKNIHFFDMDMTKPLFRSRDIQQELSNQNIVFHYEEQFMDAPTLVGGVKKHLLDSNSYVVMDVGGNDTGSNSIGGFSHILKKDNTVIYYVINPYRPWSDNIEHIDLILSSILKASKIDLKKIKIISNPNIGKDTKIEDVINGHKKLQDIIKKYLTIDFLCMDENLYSSSNNIDASIFPIKRYLKYSWEN